MYRAKGEIVLCVPIERAINRHEASGISPDVFRAKKSGAWNVKVIFLARPHRLVGCDSPEIRTMQAKA
ncbi:hypothetical protein [Bradyrhizobium liaoningense]|uniref:hypothetical protein n=1 Tax=Bradyrhizobium liaoningense TaxID=43992 RepID=UPI001BA78B0F|nr:hypothetical protein [Bradyrhizobium liaoningense]MBR0947799.1 hypothetical protein [Bradyrhizobium liaoningense]